MASECPRTNTFVGQLQCPTKHMLRKLVKAQSQQPQLTRSLLTRKVERSTRTHVGIMKNTAWQPRMLSSRRWWIRESLNT